MELHQDREDQSFTELTVAYRNLETENQDFKEGLYYASSVQQGLMPQARHFEKLKNPYFVFYRPARIIGGDFFWLGKKGDWTLYAVGDCTGHALSGAMLSSLAIGFLNYLVYSKAYDEIGEVLNELDKKWIETFKHDDEEQFNNDWLELSLVAFNSKTSTLQFSSAKRRVVIATDETITVLKGNNYPIGGWQIAKYRQYQTQVLQLKKPFRAYLYSDGFQDQLGGGETKRYGGPKFENLLKAIQSLELDAQEKAVGSAFDLWKGSQRQTDDVCLLGVGFN